MVEPGIRSSAAGVAPAASPYPVAARLADLLLAPGELFEELRQKPRLADAGALSSALYVATALVVLSLGPPGGAASTGRGILALAAALGLLGLWAWLATAAFIGLAFGGLTGVDLGYRAWLSLATHCSLVAAVVVPVEFAAGIGLGAETLQPNLAWLLGLDPATFPGALLGRISLRAAAFLALFSAGAARFARASVLRAASFVCGSWAALWLVLAWFATLPG